MVSKPEILVPVSLIESWLAESASIERVARHLDLYKQSHPTNWTVPHG